jgi:hypothetical protein
MARSLIPSARRKAGGLGAALLCAALGVPACGSEDPTTPDEPTGSSGAGGGQAGGGTGGSSVSAGAGGSSGNSAGAGGSGSGACTFAEEAHPATSATHLVMCTPITYDSNPPSGGNHYAVWAAFQSYDFPVPAGFLVHALEHGAVVFWYNCPQGCADEVAQAQAMIDALPADDLCGGTGAARRAILVPWPELDARWAASSWGFVTKADCFDAPALSSFYTAHFGRGREQLCNAGVALTEGVCP